MKIIWISLIKKCNNIIMKDNKLCSNFDIFCNNYDKNATDTNSITEISYTLENISQYSTRLYVVNNNNFQKQE